MVAQRPTPPTQRTIEKLEARILCLEQSKAEYIQKPRIAFENDVAGWLEQLRLTIQLSELHELVGKPMPKYPMLRREVNCDYRKTQENQTQENHHHRI